MESKQAGDESLGECGSGFGETCSAGGRQSLSQWGHQAKKALALLLNPVGTIRVALHLSGLHPNCRSKGGIDVIQPYPSVVVLDDDLDSLVAGRVRELLKDGVCVRKASHI
jgi:hypothetical protein